MRIARKDIEDQAEISAAVSLRTNTVGDSMTVQSQAEDADINNIMRKYGLTGRLPENPRVPTYGDFEGITDYRSAIEAVRRADEAFMEIPAEKRALFDNDPQKLLEFASDARYTERLQEIFDGKRLQSVAGTDRETAGAAASSGQSVGGTAASSAGNGGTAAATGGQPGQ